MINVTRIFGAGVVVAALAGTPMMARADDGGSSTAPHDHAPIGVMGDHTHKAGEVMFSLRVMHMDMEGNRNGTSDLSPQQIVTGVPNVHFGQPMQPANLRVVPTTMTMDMIMAGAMYAPSDWLTLMAMGSYVRKEMDHITFQGGAGTNILGGFTTTSDGFGDTKLTGLIRLYEEGGHHVHLNAGISLPTGSITQSDDVLTPMNMRPTLRLPYAMQLGSGTFDLAPGITYTGVQGALGWGAQASGTVRLGENDEGYSFGDGARLTLWGAYGWTDWLSTSFRVAGEHEGAIDGRDVAIVAPVQTANPAFYGGERAQLSAGVNLLGRDGALQGHRLGLEVGLPVYQNLNGPQMERNWTVTVGWQKAF